MIFATFCQQYTQTLWKFSDPKTSGLLELRDENALVRTMWALAKLVEYVRSTENYIDEPKNQREREK